MQNPVIVTGDVVAQLINIRKVSIDSELKVSLTIEFMATEEKSKENVFKLIQLQGDIAEMTVRPSQQDLFEHAPVARTLIRVTAAKSRSLPTLKGNNGEPSKGTWLYRHRKRDHRSPCTNKDHVRGPQGV